MPTAAFAKKKLLADLARVRRQILAVVQSLPARQQEEVFLGSWSARHVLAHLIGWDIANLQAIEQVQAGQLPSFYAAQDHDWATYNAGLVKRYGAGPFARLISWAQQSHAELLDGLTSIPANVMRADHAVRFRGYKVTIERLLLAELSDERNHLRQLRQFARSRVVAGRATGRRGQVEPAVG